MTSLTESLGTWTYRVSPGLALVGLKVILFTVRSAFMALRTFTECEGSRLGGTAMVYNAFSKLICILVMAEGGYDTRDETTDETPLIPGTGDDDDNGGDLWVDFDWDTPVDPEDTDRTQPFEPGGASTPAGGESIPMTTRTSLPQERGPHTEETSFTTPPDSIPTISKVDFVDEEARERIIARTKRVIQEKYPKVDFDKLGPIGFGKRPENRFSLVKFGAKGGETRIMKADNSDLLKSFVDSNKKALGKSAEELAAEKTQEEKELRLKLLEEEKQLKAKEQQTVLEQKAAENVRNLERRIEQTQARREEIETEHGSNLEQQKEIDRLKQLERNLSADLQNERVELKQLQKIQDKTLKETRKRVGKLRQEIYAAAKERDEFELGLNRTKTLNELDERYETLKRENEADRKIVDDDNAASSDKQAATERIIEREEEMERLGPQIQEREQELPLRERVKNIFKKYGWTLQAVALAVGIVLSALALAATNGLKAGTKALGNGLETIGKKLGSLLPGLIGSIVSYIFKAAGSVLSFLGEHAWLLILAVVAFFMERMLKRRRR